MLIRELEVKLGNSNDAKAWIEKVYTKYPQTWQNNHVMPLGDEQFAIFELVPSLSKRGAVEVKWFQAYPLRQGVGSRAMKELQAMAREDGISLTLFPWDKGQVSQAKLTKFYRGQGFKPTVKGGKAMSWTAESSGYIPRNKKEAEDPRWSSALTVDVHTDTMKKQIAKFFPTPAPKDGQSQVKENISVTGTEKAKIQRKRKIEPGTEEWFKLWFSLPYLTGEQPSQ